MSRPKKNLGVLGHCETLGQTFEDDDEDEDEDDYFG